MAPMAMVIAIHRVRARALGIYRGLEDDLDSLSATVSGAETPETTAFARAVETIAQTVSRVAGELPEVTGEPAGRVGSGGKYANCNDSYADGWRMGRVQLLLHALLVLEAQADTCRHQWRGNPRQLAASAITTARRVLRLPDSYRVGTMLGRNRVTWSNPVAFAATEIVAQSTPDIGPSTWMFSLTRELERLSALPRDVANAHRAWLAIGTDQLSLREELEDAVFEYQFESGPPEIHSVRRSLARVSEQWRAEWTARSHPITWDFPQNLFPFEVRSAQDFTALVKHMVTEGAAARASETFPLGWYDTLRPILLEAIAAIRQDVVVLARVNAAWEDAFGRWEPIAAQFGRRWKATP